MGNLVAETSRDIAYLRFIHLADEGVIRSADLLFRVGNVVAETSRDIVYDQVYFLKGLAFNHFVAGT